MSYCFTQPFQTQEELHNFTTTDSQGLPLISLILKHSGQKPIPVVLDFLCEVPDLEIISEKKNSIGEKAGEQFSKQAQGLLHGACERHEYIHIVRALLKADTKVDFCVDDLSPLMKAAMSNNTKAITLLLQHNASVDLTNIKGQTGLLFACKHKQWEAAQLLFDHGADIFHEDKRGETAFHAALTGGGWKLLHNLADNSKKFVQELKQKVSPKDLCRLGYKDLWPVRYAKDLSEQILNELVNELIQDRNTTSLQFLAPTVQTHLLATYITNAYTAGHYDCVDVLVAGCTGRAKSPHPDISLGETCKDPKLIRLTRLLLENGADSNSEKGSPLRIAAKSGNPKAVDSLIDYKAYVDAADEDGFTPLLHACKGNHLDVVDRLLKRGASVNAGDVETPLTVACKRNNISLLNRLMQNDPAPDVTKPNNDGMSPLQVAVELKHPVLVRVLMNHKANFTEWKSITLRKLCLVGVKELIDSFLEDTAAAEGHPLDKESVHALIESNNSSLLNNLLTSKKVSKCDQVLTYILQEACKAGCVEIIETLHKIMEFDRDDVDSHLNHAIRHRHPDVVEKLLSYGCNPSKGKCAITDAVQSRKILHQLLKYDLPEESLQKALLAACKDRNVQDERCVKLLLDEILKKRPDVDFYDDDQVTPLLAACLRSSLSLVRLLLSKGADPNLCDQYQNTPLSVACEQENREIASLLLTSEKTPAKPYLDDIKPEKSALWISCMRGHLDLVSLLLDANASSELSDSQGSTLLAQTHEAKQHEVVRLLLEYGTDYRPLSYVGLKTASQLGYAELAVALSHTASNRRLTESINEACTKGFPETGLGIVIDIANQKTQKRCFKLWKSNAITDHKTQKRSFKLSKEEAKQPSPYSSSPSSRNPLWQNLQNKDQFKKLIEGGHNPNVSDEQGTPLLHYAVKHNYIPAVRILLESDMINIDLRDEIGRTVLFYATKSLDPALFHKLVQKGADITVTDRFGRTILHEWDPKDETGLKLQNTLNLRDGANKYDCKKQTPLHLAVIQKNKTKATILYENGSDPEAKDINGITPIDLSVHYLIDGENIFAGILPDFPKEMNQAIPHERPQIHFSKGYPAEHRPPSALNKMCQEASSGDSETLFNDNFETPLLISKEDGFKEELQSFRDTIIRFMTDLSQAIEKEDQLIAFTPVLSGSCSEGTKVTEMDEADVLCVLKHSDWGQIDISPHEKDNFSFMKITSDELAQSYPQFFKRSILSVNALFQRVYSSIRSHIAEVLANFDNLYIVDVQSILFNDLSITPLHFVWSGKVCKWQQFSVDVVPAIRVFEDKIPSKLKEHCVTNIHHLVIVPKWTVALTEKDYKDEAFQFGFSSTENDFFCTMPIELRQGYMLAKVAKEKCVAIDGVPVSEFISSFMLKCETFSCFAEMEDFHTRIKNPIKRDLFLDPLQPSQGVLYWANKILQKLECSVAEQHLQSFFLPGSNLLAHPMYQEDYRALMYVQMCHALINSRFDNPLPWAKLALTVAQQLIKAEHQSEDCFMQEISALRDMGLSPDTRCQRGCTLLYYIIEQNLTVDKVKIVLNEWQVSVEDVDGEGNNALQVAKMMKRSDLMKYLQESVKGNEHVFFFPFLSSAWYYIRHLSIF